jgi:hypothetical protein
MVVAVWLVAVVSVTLLLPGSGLHCRRGKLRGKEESNMEILRGRGITGELNGAAVHKQWPPAITPPSFDAPAQTAAQAHKV